MPSIRREKDGVEYEQHPRRRFGKKFWLDLIKAGMLISNNHVFVLNSHQLLGGVISGKNQL